MQSKGVSGCLIWRCIFTFAGDAIFFIFLFWTVPFLEAWHVILFVLCAKKWSRAAAAAALSFLLLQFSLFLLLLLLLLKIAIRSFPYFLVIFAAVLLIIHFI